MENLYHRELWDQQEKLPLPITYIHMLTYHYANAIAVAIITAHCSVYATLKLYYMHILMIIVIF
jgi:hypothetical protein